MSENSENPSKTRIKPKLKRDVDSNIENIMIKSAIDQTKIEKVNTANDSGDCENKPVITNKVNKTDDVKINNPKDLISDNFNISEDQLSFINETVHSHEFDDEEYKISDLVYYPKIQLLFDLIFTGTDDKIDRSKFRSWISENTENEIDKLMIKITDNQKVSQEDFQFDSVTITHKSGIKVNYFIVSILRKMRIDIRSIKDTIKLRYYLDIFQMIYYQIDGMVKYIMLGYFVCQIDLKEKSENVKDFVKELRKYNFEHHLMYIGEDLYKQTHLDEPVNNYYVKFIIIYNIKPDLWEYIYSLYGEEVDDFIRSLLFDLYENVLDTNLYKFYNNESTSGDIIKTMFRQVNGKTRTISSIDKIYEEEDKYYAETYEDTVEITESTYKKLSMMII